MTLWQLLTICGTVVAMGLAVVVAIRHSSHRSEQLAYRSEALMSAIGGEVEALTQRVKAIESGMATLEQQRLMREEIVASAGATNQLRQQVDDLASDLASVAERLTSVGSLVGGPQSRLADEDEDDDYDDSR